MSNYTNNIWNYLPPEITAIVIEGKSIMVGKPGDFLPVIDPKKALVLHRPIVKERTMKKHNVMSFWNELTVEGTVVEGDWEGDPSIPRGTHQLPPYVEDYIVTTETGIDMLDYLNKSALQEIEDALLDEYRRRSDFHE